MSTVIATEPASATQSAERHRALVEEILHEARAQGATAAEAEVNVAQGLAVTVRLGEVETVEHNRDKGLAVTVYFGNKSGSASTSDLSPDAVRDTVRAACTIAKYTAEDPYAGLADPDQLAREIPELDLYHPWSLSVEQAIELAQRCEAAARESDPRVSNSEGATVSTHEGLEVYGNSHGFIGSLTNTRHSVSCAVIGQDESGMQRDYWFTVARDPADLDPVEGVGRQAALRAVRRLGARKLKTCQVPVIYEAPVAASLWSHFAGAIRGGNLYHRASFLLDQVGQPVFADFVHVFEQPHLKKGLGSTPFDNEGVATRRRDLIKDGILRGYSLDTYSARKLGLTTTGNAGGLHNLTVTPGTRDLAGLLKDMGKGLLVTELIGFGVNTVTGDYSRGAAGFWVENGEIQYPVEEITVAGNLKDMFRQMRAVGTDVDGRGNIRTGSVLIGNMMLAGN